MLGETNPKDSKPGTIRGDYCIEVGRNICHGSDAVESAQKEISLWFKPEELTKYVPCGHPWVYEYTCISIYLFSECIMLKKGAHVQGRPFPNLLTTNEDLYNPVLKSFNLSGHGPKCEVKPLMCKVD